MHDRLAQLRARFEAETDPVLREVLGAALAALEEKAGASDITTRDLSGTGIAVGPYAQSTARTVDVKGGNYVENSTVFHLHLPPEALRHFEKAGSLDAFLDPAETQRRTRIATLREACAPLAWPEEVLRAAFQQSAPLHTLPAAPSGSLMAAMIDCLSQDTIVIPGSQDLLHDFIRRVASAPSLTPEHQAVLNEWLGGGQKGGDAPQMNHDPGLLIAIIPHGVAGGPTSPAPSYEIKVWRWPDGVLLEYVDQPVPQHELEAQIKVLHQRIYPHIAHLAQDATVEFFLPMSLMVEATHEWKMRKLYDDDPEDYDDIPVHLHHRVLVRSLDRARSQSDYMVTARRNWQLRWRAAQELQDVEWCRPTSAGDPQSPPFYCPVTAEDFGESLAARIADERFLCFVETVAPPGSCNMVTRVIRRVIGMGLPTGVWFAQDTLRQPGLYAALAELLRPGNLMHLPRLLKPTHGCRPILFFDNPERMPSLAYQLESIGLRKGDNSQ